MKKKIKKIVFYSGIPRSFRTTLIGNLYEIAQEFDVVLLSEELDEDVTELLKNKELFPKLEKVIPVNNHTGPKRNIFQKNRHLHNVAKEAIYSYRPDVVVIPNDIQLFEMYLARFAKKIGATVFSIQESNVADMDKRRMYIDLYNAYVRFPRFLPLFIRSFLVQCRKYAGHLLYYWILPILVGQKPFFGKSSYILRKGISGMRDTDYRIVFSKRDYDIHIKAGVSPEKLYILNHSLTRDTRFLFEKFLFNKNGYEVAGKTITLLVSAEEIGFREKDYSFISEKEKLEEKKKIIGLVSEILEDWKIYIKPHPLVKNFDEMKEVFESISNFVEVVKPSEPVDKYIKISKAIIELPKSVGIVPFFTSLAFPEKAILSLSFNKELEGDFYKDFKGVEYIDSEDKLIQTLELIKNNKFHKEIKSEKEDSQAKEFPNFINLLNLLYLKRKNNIKLENLTK